MHYIHNNWKNTLNWHCSGKPYVRTRNETNLCYRLPKPFQKPIGFRRRQCVRDPWTRWNHNYCPRDKNACLRGLWSLCLEKKNTVLYERYVLFRSIKCSKCFQRWKFFFDIVYCASLKELTIKRGSRISHWQHVAYTLGKRPTKNIVIVANKLWLLKLLYILEIWSKKENQSCSLTTYTIQVYIYT